VKATTTEELRTVRLLPPLSADVASLRGESSPDELVFQTADGLLMSDGDWRNWRKRVFGFVAAGFGIRGSRPYDLRHSFASLLIREGASVVEVARQMGNAPSVTRMRICSMSAIRWREWTRLLQSKQRARKLMYARCTRKRTRSAGSSSPTW
jgi:integrase